MRDLGTLKYLKTMIKQLYKVRTETNNVNVIRSRDSAEMNCTVVEKSTTGRSGPTQVRTITCYNFEKICHKAREYRLPRHPACYECGIKGYM